MTTTALRRNLGTAIALSLCVAAIVAAAVLRANTQSQLDDLTRSTNGALCTFKSDLAQRASQMETLLAEHPGDPVRVFGLSVPRSQLVANLSNQQRSLKSLASLECEQEGA